MAASSNDNARFQPLYWALLLYGVSTLVSMAAMSIGAALVLVAVAVHFATRGGKKVPDTFLPLAIASAALAAAGVASLAAAEFWPLAYLVDRTATVQWGRALAKLLYLFWPLVLAFALRELNDRQRERVLQTWMGAFAVLSLIGLAQFFTGWPRPQPIPLQEGRYHATLFLGHHLSVASVWIFPLFFALERARRRRSLLHLAIAGLGGIVVFLTYSRMVWVTLPAGLVLYAVWALKGRLRWAAIAGLVVVGTAAYFTPPIQERLAWRYGHWQREELWRANWAFFQARPLTGAGMISNQELSGYYLMELRHTNDVFSGHAHNNVLDILGALGALGLLAWLFWWGRVFQILWRSPERLAWICAALVYHGNGLTQVNFWEGKVFHGLAWVIAWALVSGSAAGSGGAQAKASGARRKAPA